MSQVSQPPLSLFPQRPTGPQPHWVTRLGSSTVSRWASLRRLFTTLWRVCTVAFDPGKAASSVSWRITVRQVFFTGVEALPLVSVIAMLIGATLILQAQLVGALPGDVLGKVLVAVVLREVAPLTTAILVAGRSGTAMATELGNMKVNDEILALASLGIDPYRFIVFPRVVGTVVSVTVLTVYFGAMAIVGGFVASTVFAGASFTSLQAGFAEALLPGDLPLFALKGTTLGLIVGWLCCHYGLEVGTSPTEVPQRASQAVVTAMLACVLFSTLVTIAFYSLVGPPIATN